MSCRFQLHKGQCISVLGIAGFIPALVAFPSSEVVSGAAPLPNTLGDTYVQGFGYLFGLFPVNLMHNLVHLAVGIFGIAAATTLGGARLFNRFFAISYLLIAFMGLVPLARTTFGYMPIFGNNVWFNALTALFAGYFGFFVPGKETTISA